MTKRFGLATFVVALTAIACTSGMGGAGSSGGGKSSATASSSSSRAASSTTGGMPDACDGGATCAAPGDCPTSAACVVVACAAGCCVASNAASQTACTDDGGSVCDGDGHCVACNAASDCPATGTACVAATCVAGECGTSNEGQGTTCADHGGTECDGNGTCVPSECNDGLGDDDGKTDVDCGGPVCSPCADGKMCLVGSDCVDKVCAMTADAGPLTCQPASCGDGVQNGDETDVDCGGPACDAEGKTCAPGQGCTGAGDCASGFCQGGTTCALRPDGDACTADSQCLDGNCLGPAGHQICCDSACNGACQACTTVLTGRPAGTCASILPGMPAPSGQCVASPPCGNDGNCGAGGACEQTAAGSACGAASCSSGRLTSAGTCDGGGTCASGSVAPCPGGLACAGAAACKTACAADSDCLDPNDYCVPQGAPLAGTCALKGAAGVACTANDQCAGGVCGTSGAGSRCCAATCTPAGGDCGAIDCDGAGACVFVPSGTSCGPSSCNGGQLTPAGSGACDGAGTCDPGTAAACAGGFVCASPTACKTSCASDSDCLATGDYCAAGACVTKAGAGAGCTANDQCSTGACGPGGAGTHCCAALCATGNATCGATDCDASGACVYPPSGTYCGGHDACDGKANCAQACGAAATPPSKCVFVDSVAYLPNLGSAAAYDPRCNADAASGGLSTATSFKAWMSDAASSPASRFAMSSIPYANTHGQVVATSWAGLVSGTLLGTISLDQTGASLASYVMWTGTNNNGTASAYTCSGWTGTGIGTAGDASATVNWSSGPAHPCSFKYRIFCVEQ